MEKTPNLGLNRPDKGSTPWDVEINENFTKLDTAHKGLTDGLDTKANKVDPTITGTITMDGARKIVGLNTINGVVAYNSGGNAIVNVNGNTASVDYISVNVNGGGNSNRPLVLQNESVGANVGIGTTVPAEKLEVVGNVKATKFIGTADKANQDGSGNVITTTYATKTELGGKQPKGDYATKTELGGYLPLTGGILSGNLSGKYIKGTWLQTTAVGNAPSNTGKVAVIDGQGWVYYRTPAQLKEDIGAGGADSDNVTITKNAQGKIQTVGIIEKNNNSVIYDWVGTLKKYTDDKIATAHPDWLCYITDDVSGIPDTYTKNEVGVLLDTRANTDLSNLSTKGESLLSSMSKFAPDYSAGVSVSSGYVAVADGWINITMKHTWTTGSSEGRVFINNNLVMQNSRMGGGSGLNIDIRAMMPVCAGDVLTYSTQVRDAIFYPVKGVTQAKVPNPADPDNNPETEHK